MDLDEVNKAARAVVTDRQLSLAIGREGQNVRLATKLTGWKLDIKSLSEIEAAEEERQKREQAAAAVAIEELVEEGAPVAALPEAEPAIAEAERLLAEEAQEAVPVTAEADVPVELQGPALTPEEELLLADPTIEVEQPALEEEPAEEPVVFDDTNVWALPTTREPSVLRFAEDIMPERGRRRDGPRRGKGKRGRTGAATSEEPAK